MQSAWVPYPMEGGLVSVWVPRDAAGEFALFLIRRGQAFDYDPGAIGLSLPVPNHLFAFSLTSESELMGIVADFLAQPEVGEG